MVLLVSLDDVGQLVNAGTAPGSPKVNQHNLALIIGDGNMLAANIFLVEIGELRPLDQGPLDLAALLPFVDGFQSSQQVERSRPQYMG